eukprot:NODE_6032_length_269_cov_12.627273_g5949_i0.p1 GENE.NODE_6032_length_269_cov_12.627273_g5949_i0~~NODE_6032_length_269_cov_12.627273_g5949_i0.p1  ORF type:complete len:70 (-),score=4.67 NODE_6032_length_269_cov_12.627273_g5949_i0:39-248(-)
MFFLQIKLSKIYFLQNLQFFAKNKYMMQKKHYDRCTGTLHPRNRNVLGYRRGGAGKVVGFARPENPVTF